MKKIAADTYSAKRAFLCFFISLAMLFTGCAAFRFPETESIDSNRDFDLAIFWPDGNQTEILHIFSLTGVALSLPEDGSSVFQGNQRGIVRVRIRADNQIMLSALFRRLSEAGIEVVQCIPDTQK